VTDEDDRAARLIRAFGNGLQQALDDHHHLEHVPALDKDPVRAVPFPRIALSDVQICGAIEMMELGATLYDAAEHLGVPALALEREIADYQPRWRRFLWERSQGIG
jgi:hypothetical protein